MLQQKEVIGGFCQCGCGQRTKIAKGTDKRKGWVKGQPKSFINGHNMRGERNHGWGGGRSHHGSGYIMIKTPGHPKANRGGYVFEHILICEKALGKYLPLLSEPHHFDGNKANNVNGNLVICQDRAYHMLLEQRTRALKRCGHADWRKCCFCKRYDEPGKLIVSGPRKNRIYHRSCENDYQRDNHEKRKAQKGAQL